MKFLGLLFLMPSFALAASIFDFNSLEGYEKCLQQDHLVESHKGGSTEEHRALSRFEIQTRCIKHAAKLLEGKKDKAQAIEFIKATKRLTAPENAIDLVNVLVSNDRPSCNQMDVYLVIKKTLSAPKDKGTDSYFDRAKAAVKTCLKDAEFKKDFIEEKDSSDSYLSANTCEILTEEKVLKNCKREG